jgi:hypothetical protein
MPSPSPPAPAIGQQAHEVVEHDVGGRAFTCWRPVTKKRRSGRGLGGEDRRDRLVQTGGDELAVGHGSGRRR